jgi:hypothetical protein
VGDGYTPSAGTIYPTLTSLEEMNSFLCSMPSVNNIKLLNMGSLFKEQQDKLSGLLEKLRLRREIHSNDQLIEIHRAMENLKTALRLKLNTTELKQEQIYQIAEKIDQAAVAIGRL